MGKIKKILENELIGGTQSTDIYPVTSTKAIYDTSNKVLDDYIQHLKKTSTFAGIATPTTNPGTPDGPVFYLATQAGIYSNFGGISVVDGEAVILEWEGNWIKKTTGFATQQQVARLDEKIDDKTNEVNAAKEEALQAITENEQSAIANFNSQRVTPEMLSESTKQYIEASGGGTVTNLADDEDITSVNNLLKFANKDYLPTTYSGLGRVYLRKNFVDGKNVLTQEMLPSANTIYIVKYDYDLNGATITIQENCTLDFQGGSFSNGTLHFNNTMLQGNIIIYSDVEGSICNSSIQATAFKNSANDIGISINTGFKICNHITIPDGKFYANTQINIKGTLTGTFCDKTINPYGSIVYTSLDGIAIKCNSGNIYNIKFENLLDSENTAGIECQGSVNLRGLYVLNYYKFGIASSDNGLYYSLFHYVYVGIHPSVAPSKTRIGENGIYIKGTNDGSAKYNGNNNTFIACESHGGYKCCLNIQGNANVITGGDLSANRLYSEQVIIKIHGSSNIITGTYIENQQLYNIVACEIGKSSVNNIINIFGPAFNKKALRDLSTSYNEITMYDYSVIYNSDRYQYMKNFFDIPFSIKNNVIQKGHYIYPYFGGHGENVAKTEYTILDEKFLGEKILRIRYSNSTKENFCLSNSPAFKEYMNTAGSKQMFFSCYIRAAFTSSTKPTIRLGYSGGDTYSYTNEGEWQFLTTLNHVDLSSFLHISGDDEYTGYIDIAIPFIGFQSYKYNDRFPHIIDDDILVYGQNGDSTVFNYDKIAAINISGITSKRPILKSNDAGYQYYDTTLNKPIWWTGSAWIDATGTSV